MPTKLGKGGYGPEDFDPDTGEYTAGATISKRGNKYWVHGDIMSREITKEEYNLYKSKGYEEEFVEESPKYDINEALEIMNTKDRNLRLGKFWHLGSLIDDNASYFEKINLGKKVYNELAEQMAEQFISTLPTQKKYDVDLSMRKSNKYNIKHVFDKYVYQDEKGRYHWNSWDDYKEGKKQLWNYENNCQRCVMAFYLNFIGYNVEAKPRDAKERYSKEYGTWMFRKGSDDQYLYETAPHIGKSATHDWSLNGFIIPEDTEYDYQGTDSTPNQQFSEIENVVKNSPDKSVFFCRISYKKDGGHVFCIVNDGGEMKLIEPQDGTEKNRSVFDRIKLNRTTLIRVNDFKLNGDKLPMIVKEGQYNDL